MATIKDVAKLAGVAVSTASYALNNSKRISAATKERVSEAARQLNYKKNGIASDLKRTKTNTIALILSDLSGPYYSELIKGVQDVTTANGFDLIACSSIGGHQSTAVKFLKEKRVDGAIILAHNISDEITIESAQAGFPVIVLDRDLMDKNVYHVEVDNAEGDSSQPKVSLTMVTEILHISADQVPHLIIRDDLKATNRHWNTTSYPLIQNGIQLVISPKKAGIKQQSY